jgi:hypothetical protein
MGLQELLSEIENTEIVVPEFQREYVWNYCRRGTPSYWEFLVKH